MKSRARSSIACLLLALVVACGLDAGDLDGRSFLSQSVTEDGVARPLATEFPLELEFNEDVAAAFAGCNEFFGEFQIEDGVFLSSSYAGTKIGCGDDLNVQDDWYIGFLTSSPTISLDGDTLVLEGGGIRIEYLDEGAGGS